MVWEIKRRVHSVDNLVQISDEPPEIIVDKGVTAFGERKYVGSESDLGSLYCCNSEDEEYSPCQQQPATFTLYLIRHGEALHNILEKAAKRKAKELAISAGHAPDSDEAKARMEEARIGVLDDPDLLDAPLSSGGHNEAIEAATNIRDAIARRGLPPPQEVLVSPLQRALQTANAIFPGHAGVHVREELRERQTLKAADTPMPSHKLRARKSFAHFSMTQLCNASFKKKLEHLAGDLSRIGESTGGDSSSRSSGSGSSGSGSGSSRHGIDVVSDGELEEKHMLRERTKLLFDLLSDSSCREVAIVGHKGYLRELERGPFGQQDATEFKNCEMRAYRVTFFSGTHYAQAIERVA